MIKNDSVNLPCSVSREQNCKCGINRVTKVNGWVIGTIISIIILLILLLAIGLKK